MSVVVVGGNDCMATRYKEICEKYNCKAKVFTKMPANFEGKLGTPDLFVVFTSTVSHKMVARVKEKAEKHNIEIANIHSASASALKNALSEYC